MKYTLYIDKERDEEIIIYAHSKNELTDAIKELICGQNLNTHPIVGYVGEDIIEIRPKDVHCFYIEDKRLYASLDGRNAMIKMRLYEIEEMLGDSFIKINQSAIANIEKIERFSVSIGAALTVHFKNGQRDYVSRRQLRAVKERMGIK